VEKNKKQVMRFTDLELDIIKKSFVDNDQLLIAIRKVFLQLDLTTAEKQLIKSLQEKPELLAVIRKAFLPEIDGDAPFQQVVDLFMTLKLEDKTPTEAFPHIQAREKLIQYLHEQLRFLEEGAKPKHSFNQMSVLGDKVDEDIYIDLICRNTVIGHTEQQLMQFVVLAGQSDETVEQTKKRLIKNSTK
jgi:hypothetical protein